MPGRREKLGVALVCALLAAGCASWPATRAEVVDPIHGLLHHDWPDAIEALDPEAVRALFADAEAASATLELMAGFERVETARGVIARVGLAEEPVVAELRLHVEGVDARGARRSVVQEKLPTLVREPSGWRIAADPPTPVRVMPRPAARFADETLLRGLWFQHEAAEVPDPKGVPRKYIYGSGVAAADMDGDGWDDLVLVASDRVELFRNDGGRFERISEAVGLGRPLGRILTVALPFDFDGDGRRDLFVGAERGQPVLFRNEGARFVAVDSGIETTGRTVGAVAADFDGDGRVDLFLANHEDVYWKAPDLPYARNAEPDQLFLNEGGGRFRDATRRSGLGSRGWSLAPAAADYDGDGDVDLFVGNDFGWSALYRNDGRARFEEVSETAGTDRPVASMSVDWGDYDGDGDFDLFVAGMASGSAWVIEAPDFRVRRVPWLLDWLFRPYVREAVRAWFRGNRFYENQGDGTFTEIAATSGAADSGWAWSTVWLDFDNDGRLDLYGANGFLSGPLEDDL